MFKSRFYNKIEDFGSSIRKSSFNSSKLKEEIDFYKNIPSNMIQYFPKILSYGISEIESFYFLDKISSPTASDEYLESFYRSHSCCDTLFLKAFEFLKNRPLITQSSKESCNYLYNDKIKSRHILFKKIGLYSKLVDHVIYNQFIQKYEDLLNRYFKLLEIMFIPEDYLAFHHGDFCLTNMFLVKNELKLIDPMGYDDKFKNFHDPLYDVAKFSHSILGNYDKILNDKFDIILQEDGTFSLQIIGNDSGTKIFFKNFLNDYKYNYDQVRIREASLFLSMLPLHPESMHRLAAFILQAEIIIKELEKKYN